MKSKFFFCSAILILILSFAAWAQTEQAPAKSASPSPASVSVEAQICTAVTDRQPTGTDSTFAANVGTLYCWCKVTGMTGESSIKHIWSRDGKEVRTVDLPVKTTAFRTWSQKSIQPSSTGNWQVKIVDASGTELKNISFTIR